MLPLLFLALVADAPERCVVSGTVVDSVTGKGVARATLVLEPVDRAKHHRAATTSGDDGGWSMVDLDPGQYRLEARRSGYLEGQYGARRNGWRGAVLTVQSGAELRVEQKLVPAAAIAGTLRNRDGEPVEHAHVVLARRTAEYGRPRIEGVDSGDTDDRGQYRIHGVAPGKYFVLAELRQQDWDMVDHSPEGSRRVESDVRTWYPAAPDSSGATALTVGAGERLEGIDITLLRRRGYRVAGRVVGYSGDGRPSLTLTSLADGDVGDLEPHTTVKNAAGEFEFRNVPPGSYAIEGRNQSAPITVSATDIEGLRIEFGPPGEVRGKVTIEGDGPATVNGSVSLTYDGRRGVYLQLRPDMTFQGTNLPAKTYEVEVTVPESRKLYVKSIRAGEKDVLADGLRYTGGNVALEVVLASDGGVVEGVATNKDGRPLLGATVVLVPLEGQRGRSDLYRTATTDGSGRYALDPAMPGEYRLFAWEDVEEGAWRDPDFLKDFEKKAAAVTLGAKERKTVALKAMAIAP